MRRFSWLPIALIFTVAIFLPNVARTQASGQWHVADGDAAHDNWQNNESKISADALQGKFKLLWKLKLGSGSSTGFNELLYTPQMISSRGFKDIGVWADASSLYAVDYELGTLLWQKDFKVAAQVGCPTQNMQILMDPPRVIRFGAKSATAGKAAPVAPPPPSAADRWIGAATQGGGFGLKGVYVLTPDGYLHEQIMANGEEYAPAVKLLPEGVTSTGLNMSDKVLYTESGHCGGAANTVWSIDLNSAAHTIQSHAFQTGSAVDVAGPTIGSDGTVYIARGKSIVALAAKDLTDKDYFSTGDDAAAKVGPIIAEFGDKELVVAAGKNGSIVLLDSASLGGSDHKTPMSETGKIFDTSKSAGWQSLSIWREKSGEVSVLAVVNGGGASGKIVAFNIENKNGVPTLTQVWSSSEMRNPAPVVTANGLVYVLAGGDTAHHAVLHVLSAPTGKEVWTSGDAIQGYATLSGVSAGDGHVFLTTVDKTLYAFGIPLEH